MSIAEKTPEAGGDVVQLHPADIDYPVGNESSFLVDKIRNNRLGRWAVAGVAAGAVSLGILQLAHPSVERQLGAIRVGLSADGGGGVNVMGEDLDSPMGLIGVNGNLEAPYVSDISKSVPEATSLANQISLERDKDVMTILDERYADDLQKAATELALRTGLLMAMAGGVVFSGINEKLKPWDERRTPIKSMLGGFVGISTLFAANLGLTYATFDTADAGREMDQALSPQIEDYFVDKTTKGLVDYRKISDEIGLNITRLNRYGEAMSLSSTFDKSLVRTSVRSDEHLRTPYTEVEAIDRAYGVVMDVILGDFINTGSSAENTMLTGPKLLGVDFQGIQDIRHCASWNSTDPTICDKEGERIPAVFVLSNHDDPETAEILEELGLKNVNMTIFQVPGIKGYFAATSDGCFDTSANCHSKEGDSEANRRVGEALKRLLDQAGVTPNALFVAHHETAKALDGVSSTIFIGELHDQFVTRLPKGSTVYSVGTVGQAFGREADEAAEIIIGWNPVTGEVEDCDVIAWQSLNASVLPVQRSCDEKIGEL